jgi:hypothetical protein
MAARATYDAEQLDRIRRIGSDMTKAGPITSRSLPKIDSKHNCGPVKGGATTMSKSKKY